MQENTPVTHDRGKALIYDVFRQKIVPLKLFHGVSSDWDATERMTGWGLHNCLTVHIKHLPPAPAFKATARIGKFFSTTFQNGYSPV